MIAAVNQVHILQLSLEFKASRVAMTAVIFGDVFYSRTTTPAAPADHNVPRPSVIWIRLHVGPGRWCVELPHRTFLVTSPLYLLATTRLHSFYVYFLLSSTWISWLEWLPETALELLLPLRLLSVLQIAQHYLLNTTANNRAIIKGWELGVSPCQWLWAWTLASFIENKRK